MEKKFSCGYCVKVFGAKSSLTSHLKRIHGTYCNPLAHSARNCRENDCNFSCINTIQLIEHLNKAHKLSDFLVKNMSFKSKEDFAEWKLNLEKSTNSSFIVRNATTKSNIKRIYFECSRSGYFKKPDARKRSLKSKGSKKINGICTAHIILKEWTDDSNGEISISYCSSHYQHSCETNHLDLTYDDKISLAGQILEGVSFDKILEGIQSKVSDESHQRLQSVTKKVLHNIKRGVALKPNSIRLSGDSASVSSWVEEMKNEVENPILFYKLQGEENKNKNLPLTDFYLIVMTDEQSKILKLHGNNGVVCVDVIHGIIGYDIFLITLIVIDNYDEGFPVAFMYSNKEDLKALRIFFDCVKSKCGVINANVFTSEVSESYYAAWKSSMSEVGKILYCRWNVVKDWTENLSKIKGYDKLDSIHHALKELLDEPDTGRFISMHEDFMQLLGEEESVKKFVNYFKGNYSHKTESWAFCYQSIVEDHNNTIFENIHNVLECIYLEGKKCKRLDYSVNSLLQLVKGKALNRNTKILHEQSLELTATLVPLNNGCYKIELENDKKSQFIIERKCVICTCPIVCNTCEICFHSFTCSCPDYLIRTTLCKHIHYAAQQLKMQDASSDNFVPDTGVEPTDFNSELDQYLNSNRKRSNEGSVDNINFWCNEVIAISKDTSARKRQKIFDVIKNVVSVAICDGDD